MPIGTASAESMTDDLHVEVDELDEFDISLDSEEMLNECFLALYS